MAKPTLSEQLRNRLEDDFGIVLPSAPQRIWGEPSGSCRWHVTDQNGNEYLSYNTMAQCVKASKIVRSKSLGGNNKYFVECEA